MGCNVSRIDSQDPSFLTRFRPTLFLPRFLDVKARRNLGGPLRDSNSSKKVLLSNTDDENHANSHPLDLKGNVVKKDTEDDHFADAVDELESDDDDDGNKRMIGYEGNDAFPGSPSFRVYFKDNEKASSFDAVGDNDGFKDETYSSDGGVQSTESPADEKLQRSRKKRSFRDLPKKLLKVKSCYTMSRNSSHDNSHHLPAGKKHT